ncbi:MAG: CaiB/BaiF CoA transferase family protein [Alphaproteobacteria bacterium]
MENKLNKLPLEDIVVLDLTNVLSGPFATLILSELGAKIIKVEKPNGDDSRNFGPFIDNKSGYFISLNRGKKSIVLNLKKKKDKNVFEKLLEKSDVLIDNFKPGVLEKMGYNWKYLSKKYPKLVHSKISGFGETGPLKNNPAYDIIVQAMSGLMSITGNEKNNFVRVGTSIGDIAASLFAVIGILSQLIKRNITNKGSKLDLSMLDCQVAILENAIARYTIEKKIPEPLGTDHPSISPFGSFKTKDGEIIIAIGNDRLFDVFCKIIGDNSLYKIYNTNKKRNSNIQEFKRKVEIFLKLKNTKYWLRKFAQNKIPCANINSIGEMISNEQINHRKMVLEYPLNSSKKFKVAGTAFNFNFTKKNKAVKKAPDLDENRNEILKLFGID